LQTQRIIPLVELLKLTNEGKIDNDSIDIGNKCCKIHKAKLDLKMRLFSLGGK